MIETLVDGLDHPECVAWDERGYVLAGGEAGQLYRINSETGFVEQLCSTHGWILGICLDAQANTYLCDAKLGAVFKASPSGELTVLSRGTSERQLVTPNYPAFHSSGDLFVSDSGRWGKNDGCILRIRSSGESEVWTDGVPHFPNGLAWDAEGEWLYVAESTLPGVSRVRILSDGCAGKIERVVELPNTVPDGLAFADDGTLLIACYRPDAVLMRTSDGELTTLVEDHQGTVVAAPTNVAFGGPQLTRVFIASLARWHIGFVDPGMRGLPLVRPAPIGPVEGADR